MINAVKDVLSPTSELWDMAEAARYLGRSAAGQS